MYPTGDDEKFTDAYFRKYLECFGVILHPIPKVAFVARTNKYYQSKNVGVLSCSSPVYVCETSASIVIMHSFVG